MEIDTALTASADGHSDLFATDSSLSEVESDVWRSDGEEDTGQQTGFGGHDHQLTETADGIAIVTRIKRKGGVRPLQKLPLKIPKHTHIYSTPSPVPQHALPKFSDGDATVHPTLSDTVKILEGEDTPAKHVWLPMLGLHDFPTGYNLFTIKSESWTRGGEFRIDQYLYGHPSGKSYRSAKDFRPHLDWLVAGDRNAPCFCILCGEQVSPSMMSMQNVISSNVSLNNVSRRIPTRLDGKQAAQMIQGHKVTIRTPGSLNRRANKKRPATMSAGDSHELKMSAQQPNAPRTSSSGSSKTKTPAKKTSPKKATATSSKKRTTKPNRELRVKLNVTGTPAATPSPASARLTSVSDSGQRRRSRRGEGGGGKWKWTMRGWVWVDREGNEEFFGEVSPAAEIEAALRESKEESDRMEAARAKDNSGMVGNSDIAPNANLATQISAEYSEASTVASNTSIKPEETDSNEGHPILHASPQPIRAEERGFPTDTLQMGAISDADLEAAEVLADIARRGSVGHLEGSQSIYAAESSRL